MRHQPTRCVIARLLFSALVVASSSCKTTEEIEGNSAILATEHMRPPARNGSERNAIYFVWAGHNGEWVSRQIQAAVPAIAALTRHGHKVEIHSWTNADQLKRILTDGSLGAKAVFLSALGDGNGNVFGWCVPGSFDCPAPYYMKVAPVTPQDVGRFAPGLRNVDLCAGSAARQSGAWRQLMSGGSGFWMNIAPDGISPGYCEERVGRPFLESLVTSGVISPETLTTYDGYQAVQTKRSKQGDTVAFVWGGLEGDWVDPQVARAATVFDDLLAKGWRVEVDTWSRKTESVEQFLNPRYRALYWSSHGDGQGNIWSWCDSENILQPEADCTSPFKQKVLRPEEVQQKGAKIGYIEMCACYSGQSVSKWRDDAHANLRIETYDGGVNATHCQDMAGDGFLRNLRETFPSEF